MVAGFAASDVLLAVESLAPSNAQSATSSFPPPSACRSRTDGRIVDAFLALGMNLSNAALKGFAA
jgi:hypothetical protein